MRSKWRARFLEFYGNCCAECGTTDRLELDHVNGDGREHRIELTGKNAGGDGYRIYRQAVLEYPSDRYQVLCRSHNARKG
jgi:hypothetical protein